MAVKLEYCRSCDHTHLVGTACWFVPPVVAEVRRAPRFCEAHQVAAENETCPCCEAVHQADLLTALHGRLRGLEQHWRMLADISEVRGGQSTRDCADDLAALLAPPEEPGK